MIELMSVVWALLALFGICNLVGFARVGKTGLTRMGRVKAWWNWFLAK